MHRNTIYIHLYTWCFFWVASPKATQKYLDRIFLTQKSRKKMWSFSGLLWNTTVNHGKPSITGPFSIAKHNKLGTRLTGGREEFSTPAMLSICFSADLQWSEHSSPFWIFHAAVPLVKAASSRN